MRKIVSFLAVFVALVISEPSQSFAPQRIAILSNSVPGWILANASADCDFQNSRCWTASTKAVAPSSLLSISRASTGYAQTSSGAFVSFSANTLRITNQGLLVEEARTNLFLNSAAPATQTVTVVSGSVYTVSVYGTASVVLTGATTGTVTQGSPLTFTTTTTALVLTITGAGGAFQNVNVELGAFATSPIVTTGAAATRAADIITLSGAALTVALASQSLRTETNLGEGVSGVLYRIASWSDNTHSFRFNSGLTAVQAAFGANTASATLGSGTYAGIVKSTFGYDSTSFTAIANGGTKASSANSWSVPTGNFVVGGVAAGTIQLNGYLRRLTFGNTKGQFDGLTQ